MTGLTRRQVADAIERYRTRPALVPAGALLISSAQAARWREMFGRPLSESLGCPVVVAPDVPR